MGLPSCRKIVIAYSVFQNGCLAGSRGKKNQSKIGAAQQRRECRLGKLLADITPCRLVAKILWQVPSINAQVVERDALGRRWGWSEAARNPRD